MDEKSPMPPDETHTFSQVTALRLVTGEMIPILGPVIFHRLFVECMNLSEVGTEALHHYRLDPYHTGWAFHNLFSFAVVEFKEAPYLMMAVFDLHTGLAALTGNQDTSVVSQVAFDSVHEALEHLVTRSTERIKLNQANPIVPPDNAPPTSPLVH